MNIDVVIVPTQVWSRSTVFDFKLYLVFCMKQIIYLIESPYHGLLQTKATRDVWRVVSTLSRWGFMVCMKHGSDTASVQLISRLGVYRAPKPSSALSPRDHVALLTLHESNAVRTLNLRQTSINHSLFSSLELLISVCRSNPPELRRAGRHLREARQSRPRDSGLSL